MDLPTNFYHTFYFHNFSNSYLIFIYKLIEIIISKNLIFHIFELSKNLFPFKLRGKTVVNHVESFFFSKRHNFIDLN